MIKLHLYPILLTLSQFMCPPLSSQLFHGPTLSLNTSVSYSLDPLLSNSYLVLDKIWTFLPMIPVFFNTIKLPKSIQNLIRLILAMISKSSYLWTNDSFPITWTPSNNDHLQFISSTPNHIASGSQKSTTFHSYNSIFPTLDTPSEPSALFTTSLIIITTMFIIGVICVIIFLPVPTPTQKIPCITPPS